MSAQSKFNLSPIPARAGIGLKSEHYKEILERHPDVAWFELHPENYVGAGGPPHRYLEAIRSNYSLSLHSVGLSLGSTDPINFVHLEKLSALIARYQPHFVSDHLSWSSFGGVYFNDLLPLPYTEETLAHVTDRILGVQDFLKRKILIENPSTYLTLTASEIPEAEFLCEVARRSGCEILLDVNNVYVSATNNGYEAEAYLNAFPADIVGQIHLAGHTRLSLDGETLLIDDHGSHVIEDVWRLYEDLIARIGRRPTLIEWDTNVPDLDTWLAEAAIADARTSCTTLTTGNHADAA